MSIKMKNISQAEVLTLKEQISYQDGQVVSKSALMRQMGMLLLPAWMVLEKSLSTVLSICYTKGNPSLCLLDTLMRYMDKKHLKCF